MFVFRNRSVDLISLGWLLQITRAWLILPSFSFSWIWIRQVQTGQRCSSLQVEEMLQYNQVWWNKNMRRTCTVTWNRSSYCDKLLSAAIWCTSLMICSEYFCVNSLKFLSSPQIFGYCQIFTPPHHTHTLVFTPTDTLYDTLHRQLNCNMNILNC